MSVLQTIYNKLHGKSKTNLKTQKFRKTKEVNLSDVDTLNDEIDELYDKGNKIYQDVVDIGENLQNIANEANDWNVRIIGVKDTYDQITEQLDDLGVAYPESLQRISNNLDYFKEHADETNNVIDEHISQLNFVQSQIKQ